MRYGNCDDCDDSLTGIGFWLLDQRETCELQFANRAPVDMVVFVVISRKALKLRDLRHVAFVLLSSWLRPRVSR
jgi:hypothetical protein